MAWLSMMASTVYETEISAPKQGDNFWRAHSCWHSGVKATGQPRSQVRLMAKYWERGWHGVRRVLRFYGQFLPNLVINFLV